MTKPINPDFLDGVVLTQEQKTEINNIKVSKNLRILVFSEIQAIFNRNKPSSAEEAAARFYEAKGLMSLIPQIH